MACLAIVGSRVAVLLNGRIEHELAAIEVLVESERIEAPFVIELARLIHDIESNAWARCDYERSGALEHLLMQRMPEADSAQAKLKPCFELLDRLRQMGGDVAQRADALRSEADAGASERPGNRRDPEETRREGRR